MLLGCITLLSTPAYSQVSIGGKLNLIKLFGGLSGSSLGAGLRGEYGIDERKVIIVGFDYYLGSKDEYTTFGSPIPPGTFSIEIPVTEELKFIHFQAGSKYYLLGDYEDDMNIYTSALIGLLLAPYTTTVGEYDETKYSTSWEDQKTTFWNFTIGLGIGAERKLRFGYVFADLNLVLPASQVSILIVRVKIPTSIIFDVGVRIPF